MTTSTDNSTRSAAYSEAVAALREKHRDEFNVLLQASYAKRGIEWTPRPTESQRALATIRELLTQFPSIRDVILDEEALRVTDPVTTVVAHCPRCGEQLDGATYITHAAIYNDGVVIELAKVHIDHQCRPPQDKR